MRATSFLAVAALALALSTPVMNAQSVISAHSGVLHYYEGDVTIAGQVPNQKPGTFAEVKEKQELETQVGRAEVLLTPGVFLRLGETSAIRMNSNKLTDTRVEFARGSAILDFVEIAKENRVTVSYRDYTVAFVKKGIYRFDSAPAEFKVYTGEATVTHGTNTVTLRDGRAVPFTPALVSEKFDNRTGDPLYRWAKRRSEYIAVANLSAARQANFTGSGGSSSWYYNPYYSMFTFIPARGYMCDPFATFLSPYSSNFLGLWPAYQPSLFGCYSSPWTAWNYFTRPVYNYNGGGYGRGYAGRPGTYSAAGHYPTSIGTSSAIASYSGNSGYSGPSVSPSSSSSGFSGASGSSGFSGGGSGFSGGGGSRGGGFSGGGGGGGGASHGGGSGGGHGR